MPSTYWPHPMHAQSLSASVTFLNSEWPASVNPFLYSVKLTDSLWRIGSAKLTKLGLSTVYIVWSILGIALASSFAHPSLDVRWLDCSDIMGMHSMFTVLLYFCTVTGTLTITPAPPSLSSAPHWRTTLTEVLPLCWMSQWRQSESLPEQPSWGLLSAEHRTYTQTCISTTSKLINRACYT